MKTRSIFLAILLAATAFTFTNCGGSKKEESHDAHQHADDATAVPDKLAESSEPQFQVDERFQQQLSGVFGAYVSLKDAFVASDAAKVSAEASNTRKALAGTDMKLLSGAAHHDWMTYLEGMETSLKSIESSSDLEDQRESFSKLSESLYKSIKAYGLGGATAYYEFCPMARNNQGAFWLSDAEEIRNPYFGDQMLTCGSVKEKLN